MSRWWNSYQDHAIMDKPWQTEGRADLFSLAQVIVFVISRNSNYVSMMGLSVKLKAKADWLSFSHKKQTSMFFYKIPFMYVSVLEKMINSKYIVILMNYSNNLNDIAFKSPFCKCAVWNILITLFSAWSYRFYPLLIKNCQEDRWRVHWKWSFH